MNNNDILRLVRYISGERAPGKALSQEMFSLLLDGAQTKHFKRKIGLPEAYQPGAPYPPQVYDITQKITEDLRRFKVSMGDEEAPLMVVNGRAELPANYYYCSSLLFKHIRNYTIRYRNVEVVNDQQWNERVSSSIITNPLKYPIVNFQSGYLRVYPSQIQYLDFVYLRMPLSPVVKFKTENGVSVYDTERSVELEWDDINKIDILHIMLGDMGIQMSKPEVLQYSELHKGQGV